MSKAKTVKSIIAAQGSLITTVKFIKQDGTERVLQFNPKMAKGLVENYEKEADARRVESRKANNPDLINVMDLVAFNRGTPEKACWRSFNAASVIEIKAGKAVHKFS